LDVDLPGERPWDKDKEDVWFCECRMEPIITIFQMRLGATRAYPEKQH
jgi:hypothetical protein